MFRLTAVYPAADGAKFDWDYYTTKHFDLVREECGPHGLVAAGAVQCVPGPDGSSPPYVAVANIDFESAEKFAAALATPKSTKLVTSDAPPTPSRLAPVARSAVTRRRSTGEAGSTGGAGAVAVKGSSTAASVGAGASTNSEAAVTIEMHAPTTTRSR